MLADAGVSVAFPWKPEFKELLEEVEVFSLAVFRLCRSEGHACQSDRPPAGLDYSGTRVSDVFTGSEF